MADVQNPWLATSAHKTVADTTAESGAARSLTLARSARPAGPRTPQRGVPAPDRVDQLPVVERSAAAQLWWVGAHGGSGESSLATLVPHWVGADHAWPSVSSQRGPARVVLTARSNVRGLRAAQAAATQWASGLVPFVELLGLVIVADAPGRPPKPLRDLAQVVAGGLPRTWNVPWIESWRLGERIALTDAPRELRQVVDDLRVLLGPGAEGTTC